MLHEQKVNEYIYVWYRIASPQKKVETASLNRMGRFYVLLLNSL